MDQIIRIFFKPFFLLIGFFKAKPKAALMFVILANLVARLMMIDVADLGFDEVSEINEANNNVFGFSENSVGHSVFQPFYKIILLCWIKLTSFSVYGMRSLNALLISIGAGLVFKNIFEQFNFRAAAWVSLFYFINHVLLFHSQNIGNSSMAILLAIISTFNFINLGKNATNKGVIKLAVINILLFYVSNAFVGLILAQLILSIFLFRSNVRIMLMSFLIVLAGCNYPLVYYFNENNIVINQLNIGIHFENIAKLLHISFVDAFFGNILLAITFAMTLNIFVKERNIHLLSPMQLSYRYFFIVFALVFIFIVKSKHITLYHLEIPSLSLFSLYFTVLLGLIFGLQTFSSKINLVLYFSVLCIFLPSLQLGASKNWPSKTLVKFIENHQHSNTIILYKESFPFLFYLSEQDFKERRFNDPEFTFKNVMNVKNISDDKRFKDFSLYDTVIYIGNKSRDTTDLGPMLKVQNFSGREQELGYYKIKLYYKN